MGTPSIAVLLAGAHSAARNRPRRLPPTISPAAHHPTCVAEKCSLRAREQHRLLVPWRAAFIAHRAGPNHHQSTAALGLCCAWWCPLHPNRPSGRTQRVKHPAW